MLKTILLGSRVLVQGTFVKKLANGQIAVKDGEKIYQGTPISKASAA